MKNLGIYSLVVLSSLLFSCNNDEVEKQTSEKYTSENVTNFIKLTGDNPDNSNKFKRELIGGDEVNVVIFKVRIARASTGCTRGLGFCDFEWFPDLKKSLKMNEIDVKLSEVNESGKTGYTYIYSENELPADLPKELLEIKVDNDIETIKRKGISAKISAGEYEFDKNIGKYGGYKIPVELED